jgi:hypothetical protein
MSNEINWRQNCLTVGPHDGRPEALWNLPLLQIEHMFTPAQLHALVIDRVYNDAMQMVEHGDEPRFPQAWARQIREYVRPAVFYVYQKKIDEITEYYRSPQFKRDVDGVIELNQAGKLNPGYKPLHSHDSINMLCRIVGVSASTQASKDFAE